ncbi:MAG: signal peptidase I [Lachnospiraceae bacterium]|nr:signal peptidase I [Lachnospiraceae bacterium]
MYDENQLEDSLEWVKSIKEKYNTETKTFKTSAQPVHIIMQEGAGKTGDAPTTRIVRKQTPGTTAGSTSTTAAKPAGTTAATSTAATRPAATRPAATTATIPTGTTTAAGTATTSATAARPTAARPAATTATRPTAARPAATTATRPTGTTTAAGTAATSATATRPTATRVVRQPAAGATRVVRTAPAQSANKTASPQASGSQATVTKTVPVKPIVTPARPAGTTATTATTATRPAGTTGATAAKPTATTGATSATAGTTQRVVRRVVRTSAPTPQVTQGQATRPVTKPAAQATAARPATKPAAQATATRPATKPAAQTTAARPATKPVAQTTAARPATQAQTVRPTTQAQATAKPVERTQTTTARPATQVVRTAPTAQATRPATKPAAQATTRPATQAQTTAKPVAKPQATTARQATQPQAAKPVVKPAAQPQAAKPVVKPVAQPVKAQVEEETYDVNTIEHLDDKGIKKAENTETSVDPSNPNVKTLNITINFDFTNLKKAFTKVKNFFVNGFKPDERSLDDAKEAMKENDAYDREKILKEAYGDNYKEYLNTVEEKKKADDFESFENSYSDSDDDFVVAGADKYSDEPETDDFSDGYSAYSSYESEASESEDDSEAVSTATVATASSATVAGTSTETTATSATSATSDDSDDSDEESVMDANFDTVLTKEELKIARKKAIGEGIKNTKEKSSKLFKKVKDGAADTAKTAVIKAKAAGDSIDNPDESEGGNKLAKKVVNIFTFAICLVLAFVVAWGLNAYVVSFTHIDGSSMEPSFSHKDLILVNKLAYKFKDPKRYDVIVFRPRGNSTGTYFIKRVVAVPGETVWISEGKVFVRHKDGTSEALDDQKYALSEYIEDAGEAAQPMELNKNMYFVLGDNRNQSTDSRDPLVGIVSKSDIEGKASFCMWPLKRFGSTTR